MATRLLISGRVQGVGYRANLAATASRLGLHGWVRNLRDGAVEACVQGEQEKLDALLAWARRGPPLARVDDVVVTPADDMSDGGSIFSILPTL